VYKGEGFAIANLLMGVPPYSDIFSLNRRWRVAISWREF